MKENKTLRSSLGQNVKHYVGEIDTMYDLT